MSFALFSINIAEHVVAFGSILQDLYLGKRKPADDYTGRPGNCSYLAAQYSGLRT